MVDVIKKRLCLRSSLVNIRLIARYLLDGVSLYLRVPLLRYTVAQCANFVRRISFAMITYFLGRVRPTLPISGLAEAERRPNPLHGVVGARVD